MIRPTKPNHKAHKAHKDRTKLNYLKFHLDQEVLRESFVRFVIFVVEFVVHWKSLIKSPEAKSKIILQEY